MSVQVSIQTINTALVYLNELCNYIHDTPEELEECMVALEEARCGGRQSKTPDCDLCQDLSFICQICEEDGEIEVEGMAVKCPGCNGWPTRCPNCGGES